MGTLGMIFLSIPLWHPLAGVTVACLVVSLVAGTDLSIFRFAAFLILPLIALLSASMLQRWCHTFHHSAVGVRSAGLFAALLTFEFMISDETILGALCIPHQHSVDDIVWSGMVLSQAISTASLVAVAVLFPVLLLEVPFRWFTATFSQADVESCMRVGRSAACVGVGSLIWYLIVETLAARILPLLGA